MSGYDTSTTLGKIAVMQAYADGKKIQNKMLGHANWGDVKKEPCWDWNRLDYRIKPEPREFYISVNEKGFATHYSDGDEKDGWQKVKVREVIEP